jgi:hypothetical protein
MYSEFYCSVITWANSVQYPKIIVLYIFYDKEI